MVGDVDDDPTVPARDREDPKRQSGADAEPVTVGQTGRRSFLVQSDYYLPVTYRSATWSDPSSTHCIGHKRMNRGNLLRDEDL